MLNSNTKRAIGLLALAAGFAPAYLPAQDPVDSRLQPAAKNVIFFVGDGMGVSTVTATRIFSVGVAGELTLDQAPFVGLSRTYSEDAITADSAPTMSAMVSGVNTNNGVMGFGPGCENKDFNNDGDGAPVTTIIELAKARGMMVGIISTARITHATPAACFAKTNDRDLEAFIADQALPGSANYNLALGSGIDLLMGGGRQFFVPSGVADEEGGSGSRADGRDLRAEFQATGYHYVWNQAGFDALTASDLPVLGLFERSHMEWEYDRPTDLGGEPSLEEMTAKAVAIFEQVATNGYILVIESGRIDHAHHAGNAYRALVDTEELDRAVNASVQMVDLNETLVLVTADHSHVFNIAGYPLRPQADLQYAVSSAPPEYTNALHGNVLTAVYDINTATGAVEIQKDSNGVPYTTLLYGNGPGYRSGGRVDPFADPFPGLNGLPTSGPEDPEWRQDSGVPLGSETHAGEEVAVYAWGPLSSRVHGTEKNTAIFFLMKRALGL